MGGSDVSRAEYLELLADRNDLVNQLEAAVQQNWLAKNLGKREQLALLQVAAELAKEQRFFGPYPSLHHGVSVIRQRYKGIEEQVFKKPLQVNHMQVRMEAIKLAAAAVNMMVDSKT